MHDFLLAFIGGAILGVAVVGFLFVNGKITGISGLIAQLFQVKTLLQSPALWFLLGLVITPFVVGLKLGSIPQPEITLNANALTLVMGGLLVGFGTRLGSGCTSGHGICGISRLSKRSIVATAVFMLAAALTVFMVRQVVAA